MGYSRLTYLQLFLHMPRDLVSLHRTALQHDSNALPCTTVGQSPESGHTQHQLSAAARCCFSGVPPASMLALQQQPAGDARQLGQPGASAEAGQCPAGPDRQLLEVLAAGTQPSVSMGTKGNAAQAWSLVLLLRIQISAMVWMEWLGKT